MKIGIIGDVHWSKYSSILRSRGNKFSERLENCIESINWAESATKECDIVVYLGDFFDSPDLKSEELSALSEINWNRVDHYFLVGNHELGLNDLSFSSSHIFNLVNSHVIDRVTNLYFDDENFDIYFVPYILNNSGDLSTYLPVGGLRIKNRIVFSHNDIAGIQMGSFISKLGFDINSIESNCDLFINGHLHNGTKITDKIYNIGNLTGQNFSEDASIYSHNIFILDTDDLYNIKKIENPYALKFFKFDSVDKLLNFNAPLNSIITCKLYNNELQLAKDFLTNNKNIKAHRFIVIPDKTDYATSTNSISLSINHLEKFKEFIFDKLGSSDIVSEEIEEVVR